jgi:hypothetical protein
VAQRCRGGDGKWCGGVDVVFGGGWEKRDRDGGGKTCTVLVKVGGKGRNSDLKIGHVRVQLECNRSYVGAFDRIYAECVCEIGQYGRTNANEFERSSVSTFECKGCVRM